MPNPNHLGAQNNKRRGKTISRSESMKAEYDFSKAERGKFYHPDAVFSFPIYLEPEINDFLQQWAEHKKVDVQDLVNDLLRVNVNLIRSVQ